MVVDRHIFRGGNVHNMRSKYSSSFQSLKSLSIPIVDENVRSIS